MANKPPILCNLQRGKVIDAQQHFVDTFNWLVDFASRMKGVSGIEIKGIDRGQPEMSVLLEAGDGIKIETAGDSLKVSAILPTLKAGSGVKVETDSEKNETTIAANLVAGDNVTITDEDGALKISAESGGDHYVKGDDTNIVFTERQSGDIAIDVYYS